MSVNVDLKLLQGPSFFVDSGGILDGGVINISVVPPRHRLRSH